MLDASLADRIKVYQMGKKLRQAHLELEQRVKDRTNELTNEISFRKTAEKNLKQQIEYLLQANKALKSILENRKAEQRDCIYSIYYSQLCFHIKKSHSKKNRIIKHQ